MFKFREKIENGDTILVAWSILGNPLSTEILGKAGFDAILMDMQHASYSSHDLMGNLQAVSTTPAIPVVRTRWNTPMEIMTALDFGAIGIICPMINTADEARQMVANCRYAPVGNRSFGPLRSGITYGSEYTPENANRAVVTMAMVETKQAYENLDEILSVEGLDGIFVGPGDLSIDMGFDTVICAQDDDKFDAIITDIATRTNQSGRFAGIYSGDAKGAKKRQNQGYRFIDLGVDAHYIIHGAARELEAYKNQS